MLIQESEGGVQVFFISNWFLGAAAAAGGDLETLLKNLPSAGLGQ